MKNERKSFGGTIGFVLAASASAVGLGNIWRFPYLAAKDGGGIFLLVYLVLALTFGFTLITAELSIGRSTKLSPILAYDKVKKGWKPLGLIACLVPFMILPYYVSIGGWVLKYFLAYITGQGAEAATDGYFGAFITSVGEPVIMMALFLAAVAFIVIMGVDKGIEASAKILMPILLLLVIGIAIFAGVLGIVVCFGYNLFYFEISLPNGATAQILDLMDYVSNNVLMPIVAIATCILIGWVVKPSFTINEFEKNGNVMGRKTLFTVMIRYITPVLLFLLFLKAIGILNI